MRLLHTSDWHVGRSFHGASTLAHLERVLEELSAIVVAERVDVVVVSGDIFDTGTPSAQSYASLGMILRELHRTGVRIVLTSGNHDSAQRLGFLADFAADAGVYVRTDPERLDEPIELSDEHGPVLIYGIPYLEPALLRYRYPDADLRGHERTLRFAMDRIRADIESRPAARTVVAAHVFATGAHGGDGERDITAGGIESVPLDVFDGVDYVALGHIHGRATLASHIRYSGAPLHYSFSEANKPRGAWIAELDAGGLGEVRWVDLPIPRPLSILRGTLEEILADPAHEAVLDHWISARLTDPVRPLDPMRRLQERFPFAVTLEHEPEGVIPDSGENYSARVRERADDEIIAGFLELVRDGVGPDDEERALITDLIRTEQGRGLA
ncbi:exonuclease SbcCD subunit D [Mycetocola tolaasinivorans]|uniref:Nuclease SbcCD subunit D n=1 Tax=Mycetocola tolaasinivorans TaxID=76635 RepID=A0A3L7AEQ3_9MICO|nr:exonuclease SbcCD subunit D [Mycetocola tolaasinivorans]RLP78121.1 exonuclease SbcCD subunit D [Mycetocola tolaasinivorans]